jgi:hypothetical protein
MARSTARATRGASGIMAILPPSRTLVRVRWPRSRPSASEEGVITQCVDALDVEQTLVVLPASARPCFHGHRERWARWQLVTSREPRRQLGKGDPVRLMDAMVLEVDRTSDRFPSGQLTAESGRSENSAVGSTGALHRAQASIRPWVRLFIADDGLRTRAARAGLPPQLRVPTSIEAGKELRIGMYECPPSAPHPSSRLANSRWWILGHGYDRGR